ncbi:competence/damage-inducible protein A [Candidatus Magnetaquicoccus inordinatus]|uniref:competence/damage-inducible protein A n=1 Tax=Candidatus Magnetaquicoccus inordinatus TaxID=2496818 RepID=UPI00187D54C2|nr:molybdopterin-binding protein [Candidatus Magnetaquicoccus inordinatus]
MSEEKSYSPGLLVIGDEILSGRRVDAHLPYVSKRLHERGMALAWARFVGDEASQLVHTFQQTLAEERPVFCFGGIGSTPDDRTRECLAQAAGVPLLRHPDAVREIEARFGVDPSSVRLLMADWPQGSSLLPNPVNRIPGFCFRAHYALPGFPELAWPMLDWLLEHYFPLLRPPETLLCLRIEGAGESRVVLPMQRIAARFPQVRCASLPKLGSDAHILLSVCGRGDQVHEAFAALTAELTGEALSWQPAAG